MNLSDLNSIKIKRNAKKRGVKEEAIVLLNVMSSLPGLDALFAAPGAAPGEPRAAGAGELS